MTIERIVDWKVIGESEITTMSGYTSERKLIELETGELFFASRIDRGGDNDQVAIFPATEIGEIDTDKYLDEEFELFEVRNMDHESAIDLWLSKR